jgi:hypothetical protein
MAVAANANYKQRKEGEGLGFLYRLVRVEVN